MINKALFSSNSEEWSTPQELFDELNKEFHFTLDAAANKENAKCKRYFDKEKNGLAQSWGGEAVWCNPPYGRQIGEWMKKALEETKQSGTVAVMLVPARTDTSWFHSFVYHRAELRFLRGRLRFGNADNGAPFPSMLAIFRGPE